MQNHSPDSKLAEKTDLDCTILDTARTVFETYGVRRANIEDVAARAGVSRSTIYRRFPTKEDLFLHVVRREAELSFGFGEQTTDEMAVDLIGYTKDSQHLIAPTFTAA